VVGISGPSPRESLKKVNGGLDLGITDMGEVGPNYPRRSEVDGDVVQKKTGTGLSQNVCEWSGRTSIVG